MDKVCKLINAPFSWVLEVDGRQVAFQGADNADYFAEHYEKLGYKIEWDKNNWKKERNHD